MILLHLIISHKIILLHHLITHLVVATVEVEALVDDLVVGQLEVTLSLISISNDRLVERDLTSFHHTFAGKLEGVGHGNS